MSATGNNGESGFTDEMLDNFINNLFDNIQNVIVESGVQIAFFVIIAVVGYKMIKGFITSAGKRAKEYARDQREQSLARARVELDNIKADEMAEKRKRARQKIISERERMGVTVSSPAPSFASANSANTLSQEGKIIRKIIDKMISAGGDTLLIAPGSSPMFQSSAGMKKIPGMPPVSANAVERIVLATMDKDQKRILHETGKTVYDLNIGNRRVAVETDYNGAEYQASYRLLPSESSVSGIDSLRNDDDLYSLGSIDDYADSGIKINATTEIKSVDESMPALKNAYADVAGLSSLSGTGSKGNKTNELYGDLLDSFDLSGKFDTALDKFDVGSVMESMPDEFLEVDLMDTSS